MTSHSYREIPSFPLNSIDVDDRWCCISRNVSVPALTRSMEQFGLINPPLLAERQDGGVAVACGFRRVASSRELGWDAIPVRMADRPLNALERLLIAFHDNLPHREFDDMEKAAVVEKFTRCMDRRAVVESVLPLLGLHPHERELQRYLSLGSLPEEMRAPVAAGNITLDAALALAAFPPHEQNRLASFLEELNVSASRQMEILELVSDIRYREEIGAADVIADGEIEGIRSRGDLNRPQKAALIRGRLKRRRFPQLSAMEDDYAQWLASLKLAPTVGIKHAPFFEGPTRRVEFSAVSHDELGRMLETLMRLFREGKLTPLFEDRYGL